MLHLAEIAKANQSRPPLRQARGGKGGFSVGAWLPVLTSNSESRPKSRSVCKAALCRIFPDVLRLANKNLSMCHPAAKGVRQKELGKNATRKVTDTSLMNLDFSCIVLDWCRGQTLMFDWCTQHELSGIATTNQPSKACLTPPSHALARSRSRAYGPLL